MPIIYRKTPKGVTEIETRVHRLHPRLRGVLILIDGRRTDTELVQMLQHAAESIVMLLEGGFIEVLMRMAAAPAPTPTPTPAPTPGTRSRPAAAAPAAAPALATATGFGSSFFGGSGGDQAFLARRRQLLRMFNDQLGPAGETLAMRMETTRTLEEFRALLPSAIGLISELRGRAAAERFAEESRDI